MLDLLATGGGRDVAQPIWPCVKRLEDGEQLQGRGGQHEHVHNFIRMRICDIYSGSMKITSCRDHISHCKTASDTNWSNGWIYGVFITDTRRD